MPSPPRYRKGDTIGGRFLVHQALQGGMGEVYLCLDVEQDYPVALKTFQQRYLTNRNIQQLFEEEVGTWVVLEQHPNIVRCFYMQPLDNQPFMVLEWIAGAEGRGTDLRSWLWRGPLDLRLALDFTIDICRGLLHANEKQPSIVHRDLKPDNILVSQERLAKITDFGLAMVAQRADLDLADDDAANDHTTHQHTRRAGNAVGTPPYMSPEQWQGAAVDARADIYAVGCILYELLTGQPPYRATTFNGFRRQHEQAPLPTLPSDSRLPPALNDLLAGCLAKRPADRFPDVVTLLETVTNFYRQQIGAEPRPTPEAAALNAADYTNRGTTYNALGRYADALADYTRAIETNDTFAIAYYSRGTVYNALGRYSEALDDFTRAIEIDPAFAPAYSNRGLTYKNLECYDEALDDFTRAIEIDPAFAPAYSNRGNVYNALGRYSEALPDFTHAIEFTPTYSKAHSNISSESSTKGLADFTGTIELHIALARVYYNRGVTYSYLTRPAEALADYTRAIELNSIYAKAYYNRGVAYTELGRSVEALTDFKRTIEIDPADALAHVNIGALFASQDKLHEALPYFEQAAQLGSPEGVEYAALARQQLGIEAVPSPQHGTEGIFPAQQAFYAMMQASSLDELRQVVAQFPFMADPTFMQMVEQFIAEQVPPEERPYYEQRLTALQQIAEEPSTKEVSPGQQASYALGQAGSLDELRQVVAQFPFMTEPTFIQAVNQAIAQRVSPEQRQPFEQRLSWLRQIADEQQ